MSDWPEHPGSAKIEVTPTPDKFDHVRTSLDRVSALVSDADTEWQAQIEALYAIGYAQVSIAESLDLLVEIADDTVADLDPPDRTVVMPRWLAILMPVALLLFVIIDVVMG